MTKLKDGLTNNTLKGAFKPPRWIAFGLSDGVPFRRAYRQWPRKLQQKAGITHLTVIRAQ